MTIATGTGTGGGTTTGTGSGTGGTTASGTAAAGGTTSGTGRGSGTGCSATAAAAAAGMTGTGGSGSGAPAAGAGTGPRGENEKHSEGVEQALLAGFGGCLCRAGAGLLPVAVTVPRLCDPHLTFLWCDCSPLVCQQVATKSRAAGCSCSSSAARPAARAGRTASQLASCCPAGWRRSGKPSISCLCVVCDQHASLAHPLGSEFTPAH